MKVFDPLQRVLRKKPHHFVTLSPIKIDRLSPRSAVRIGEIRPELRQIIPLRPKMVVNHIEHHRHSALMTSIHQSL